MQYHSHMTDTFGGEANYCWVKSVVFDAPDDAKRSLLVRRAKKLFGMSGVPCRVDEYGEQVAIYPRGMNVVIFISWN